MSTRPELVPSREERPCRDRENCDNQAQISGNSTGTRFAADWERLLYGPDRPLRAVVGGTYPLGEAAEAHRALLERRSTGKLVLDPRR